MRRAIRILALGQTLSLTITLAVSSSFAFAENAKDEPSAEDLKNSKERNVILLSRPGQSESAAVTKADTTKAAVHQKPISVKHISSSKTAGMPHSQAKAALNSQAKAALNSQAKAALNSQTLQLHTASTKVLPAISNLSAGQSIINVWLDKKGAAPQYREGDKMKINVSASQDCNVMIFDFDGRGKLTQLYPNEYQQKTLLRAGDTITFGGADSPFDYQVSLPKGSSQSRERIFVYAYPVTEKPLSIALNTAEGSPFRSGEMTLAQYKKMVAESKVFFNGSEQAERTSGERDVKIVPKSSANSSSFKLVASDEEKASGQPNKKEVSFTILGN